MLQSSYSAIPKHLDTSKEAASIVQRKQELRAKPRRSDQASWHRDPSVALEERSAGPNRVRRVDSGAARKASLLDINLLRLDCNHPAPSYHCESPHSPHIPESHPPSSPLPYPIAQPQHHQNAEVSPRLNPPQILALIIKSRYLGLGLDLR